MNPIEQQIRDIVDRETRAWNAQDVDLLISCFHPAMVWPWPPTPQSHDPMTWVMVLGRFDAERWKRSWQELRDHLPLRSHLRVDLARPPLPDLLRARLRM